MGRPQSDWGRHQFCSTIGPISDRIAAAARLAIIVGLAHALLPYGVLTIIASLNGLNPNLERAAMSLGANRFRTFLHVTLPLTLPGIIGGFLLAFAISISAYATPAILGGPATEVMATMIRTFMAVTLDWALGSAMGAILVSAIGRCSSCVRSATGRWRRHEA